jgi:hypothetical protein
MRDDTFGVHLRPAQSLRLRNGRGRLSKEKVGNELNARALIRSTRLTGYGQSSPR